MTKLIAIAGSQGTGKTYLARGLTNELNRRGKNSDYVSEVAREWIGKFGIPKDVADQLDIFQLQLEREDSVLRNKSLDYLVVDSPLYLPYMYGVLASDVNCTKEQYRLQRLFSRVLKYSTRYSYNIILDQKKHKDNDSIRVWDDNSSALINHGIMFFIQGCRLSNTYKSDESLEFDARVIDVVNFIENTEK